MYAAPIDPPSQTVQVDLRQGDCRAVLQTLPTASVHCCVTSPPYWALRSYNTPPTEWGGEQGCPHEWQEQSPSASSVISNSRVRDRSFLWQRTFHRPPDSAVCIKCGAWSGSLGLEPTPELYVEHLVEVFRAVRQVLRDDGTLWLNLGDSYAGSWGNYHPGSPPGKHGQRVADTPRWQRRAYCDQAFLPPTAKVPGLRPKNLVGIPWRVALALQADGWILRTDIIWHKGNAMPESVKDRPTRAHEYLFLLAKSRRYYYDYQAIQEPLSPESLKRLMQTTFDQQTGGPKDYGRQINPNRSARRALFNLKGRVLCPEWEDVARRRGHASGRAVAYGTPRGQQFHGDHMQMSGKGRNKRSVWTINTAPFRGAHYATSPPDLVRPCILVGCPRGGTVLDPFAGACTTGLVAAELGRHFIGIELSEAYVALGRRRLFEPLREVM